MFTKYTEYEHDVSRESATLAFSNDCDFGNWDTYCEVRSVFSELGLPFEDSFWLFDPGGSDFGLFKSSMKEKGPRHDELLEEIAAGRLAVLHGGANLDETPLAGPFREALAEGLTYLEEKARVPKIWVNHGSENNRQNIGYNANTYHRGDTPGNDFYCLDLLTGHGVEFFWTDADYDNDHFCLSPVMLRAYARDGREIYRFRRFRGSLPKAPDAQTLSWQLNEEHLCRLENTGGGTVIYQHWHVHRTSDGSPHTALTPVFPKKTIQSLTVLAQKHQNSTIQLLPLREMLLLNKELDVENH